MQPDRLEQILASRVWDVCRAVYFPRKMSIRSPKTHKQYFFACENFEKFLGRPAIIADLTDDNLYGLVRFLEQKKLAPKTVNERVGRLKSLWSWLHRRGYLTTGPTVERIPEPRRMPLAWSEEQLRQLFAALELEDLPVGPLPGPRWWLAWHCLAWNTAERLEALMSVRWDWLAGDRLHVPAEVRKSRTSDIVYQLWPETLAVLDSIREPPRELILPWPYSFPSTWYNRYERILARAGLPHDRKSKAHRMRVSHATWVRALSGHSAANLGHASEETTKRHYEDQRICGRETPKLFIPWRHD